MLKRRFLPGLLLILLLAVVASPALAHSEEELTPSNIALANLLNLVGIALSAGIVGYWLPALRLKTEPKYLRQIVIGGWAVAGIAGLVILIFRADLEGIALPDMLRLSIERGANGMLFGTLWLIRTAIWLVAGIPLILAFQRPSSRRITAPLAAILLSISQYIAVLYSHAPTIQPVLDLRVAEALRDLALATLLGGMALFMLINLVDPRRRPTTPRLEALLLHYARLPVLVTVLTWLYVDWSQILLVAALPTTLYGQVLLLKVIAFLPAFVLGLLNLIAMQRSWTLTSQRRSLIGAELGVVLVAVVVFGGIGWLNPTRASIPWQQFSAVDPVYETTVVNDLSVDLQISSSKVGENTLYVVVIDAQTGVRLNDAAVLLTLTPADTADIRAENTVTLASLGDGIYSAASALPDTTGDWTATATINRPDSPPDTRADFSFTVYPPPAPPTIAEASAEPNASFPTFALIVGLLVVALMLAGVGGYFAGRADLKRLPPVLAFVPVGILLAVVALALVTTLPITP